jgi:hypothetical protein
MKVIAFYYHFDKEWCLFPMQDTGNEINDWNNAVDTARDFLGGKVMMQACYVDIYDCPALTGVIAPPDSVFLDKRGVIPRTEEMGSWFE